MTKIFLGNRHTMQRSPIFARPDLFLGDTRGGNSLIRGDGGVALERGIDFRDPLEQTLREIHWRQLA
jgi:hypothetical protein